jgi:ligand-binding sensor domain-containing protein
MSPTNRFHPREVSGILAALLFFLIFSNLQSQNMRFDHLSVKQGLSQGNVVDIFQDKFKFIWVATEDGLNVYDGYSFQIYRHNPADSFSLSNNNVDCITQDKDGNLWVGTQDGLNFYNRKLNRFESYFHNPDDPSSLSGSDIDHIFIDSKEQVWVGTTKGLSVLNPETGRFRRYLHDPQNPRSIPDDGVSNIMEDSRGRVWIASAAGISVTTDGKSFTTYSHNPEDPESLSSNRVTNLYEDTEKNIWVGTFDAGLNKMHPTKFTFTRYKFSATDPKSLGNNYVYNIAESKAGEFWIATDGALNLMDRMLGTFKRVKSVQGNETGLSSDIVGKVYFDADDRMWVGTRFGGLNIYDKDKYAFLHYKYNGYEANCLSNNNVTDFAEADDGSVYITTDGGSLNHFDPRTGEFKNWVGKFSTDKILSIAIDKNRNLWLGTWAGGLNFYSPQTNKIKTYRSDPNDPKSLADDNIFDIHVTRSGDVWIGTWGNGVCKYNFETDDFTRFTHDNNNPNSLSGSPIAMIFEDSFGKIWIGTEQEGLDLYDPETEKFTHYRSGAEEGKLSSNAVYSIYEDSKNRMWFGTNGSGLNLLDRKSGSFTVFRQKDGLPNDAILGILEDKNGNIWLSTNKGISRFDPEKKVFKNYTESDGLQSDQFTRWAFSKLPSGQLLFGGTNGFNMFLAENIRENTTVPPVYITDFKLFNKSVPIGEDQVLKQHVMLTNEITLSNNQNIFSIDFTAINFRQPEKNRYKYLMEGFQDEWIDAGSDRKVSYTNLSPGEYTFKVVASNNDGVWNNEGATLKVIIVPPFWRTWWFTSLIVITAASTIIGYNRYIKKKARQQQEDLKRVIEERTREITLQSQEIVKKAEQEKVVNWITQGAAMVSETISKNNNDLNQLARQTLHVVVNYIQAHQGVMAIAEKDQEDKEFLKVYATYGVKLKPGDERIEPGSGMLGATFQDKEMKVIDNLPKGYLKIESGLGESTPGNIILLPMKTEDGEVLGVIELGFLGTISPSVVQFLEKISTVIALNIYAATLSHKTMMLLQESKERTEEMRAQEEEMRQNMEELEATTEEFRRREQEYQNKVKELQAKLDLMEGLRQKV